MSVPDAVLTLLLAKVAVSVLMVLGLTLAAEHGSPRLAGILSGYPLGVALALYFIGIEQGARFAAASAVHTLAGFSASLALVYAYQRVGASTARFQVVAAALVSVAVFLGVAATLSGVPFNLPGALVLTVSAMLLGGWRFRRIENVAVQERIRLTPAVLLARPLAAAAIVLAITGLAGVIGERWAGVLSAFPITLFPFLVIIHRSYGRAYAQTVIRNFPLGMGALVAYVLAVALAYPPWGVAAGTALAFLAASGYLLAYFWFARRRKFV